jgi:hypothetical protein
VPNALVYRTTDPTSWGPKVEELVRKDVNSPVPLHWRVLEGPGSGPTVRNTLADFARLLGGLQSVDVGAIEVELPWHRPARLVAIASRMGPAVVVGRLVFDVTLARPVDAEAGFEKTGRFGSASFVGGSAATRLAAKPDLGKRAGKVLRDFAMFGGINLQVKSSLQIEPDNADESRLRIGTLAHQKGALIATGKTEAGEVLAIAKEIEAAL